MRIFYIMLFVVGFVRLACADDTNTLSDTVTKHRQKYIALQKEYAENYNTIITNEPRRYAHVQAEIREQDALIRLGYLVETNIAFHADWSDDFSRALWRASLTDREVASITLPYVTNGLRVVRVRARTEDVQAWQKIIKEYDKR